MKKSESKKGVRVETKEMNDLFNNTQHADTRPEAIKTFQDLQQEQDNNRKQNQMDIDGLPLFSENEREARNTKQERIL